MPVHHRGVGLGWSSELRTTKGLVYGYITNTAQMHAHQTMVITVIFNTFGYGTILDVI